LNGAVFEDTTELFYLPPNPWGGSTVKLDRRTNALWVKQGSSDWDKTIPFGWYDVSSPTLFLNGGYLDSFK
jgi:hypothetical protein